MSGCAERSSRPLPISADEARSHRRTATKSIIGRSQFFGEGRCFSAICSAVGANSSMPGKDRKTRGDQALSVVASVR